VSTTSDHDKAGGTDPGQVIADAVRQLAREASGQPAAAPAAEAAAEAKFSLVQIVTLVVIALDLAFVAVLAEPLLKSPAAKVAQNLLVWLLGGAVVAYRDELRKAIHRLAARRVTLGLAAPLAALLGTTFFGLPVPLSSNGRVSVSVDSATAVMRPGETSRTVWIRGFGPHELRVVELRGTDRFESRLGLRRMDLAKSMVMSAVGVLPGVSGPAFEVAAWYPISVNREPGIAALELEGRFPPLVARALRRDGVDVRSGGRGQQVAAWTLDPVSPTQDLVLPPGRFTVRLKRDTCVQRLGDRVIAADSALNFEGVACTR